MAITFQPIGRPPPAAPAELTAGRVTDTSMRWQGLVRRIGFLASGSLLMYWAMQAWARGQIGVHHEVLFMVIIMYAFAFVLLGAAVADVRWLTRWQALIPIGVLLGLAVNFYVDIEIAMPFYGTDTIAFSHEAAERLLQGENPFSVHGEETIAAVSERYDVPSTFVTPTTDGVNIDRLMSWPAGHLLLFVLPLKLGLTDLRWVVVVAELATLLILWLKAPASIRPLALLPIAMDPDQSVRFTSGGVTDFLWVLPLVGTAFFLRDRRYLLAALLFGTAAAVKQQPWLLAPFLAIWVWHDHQGLPAVQRARMVATFAVASLIGFLILNLPFAVWDPRGWLQGVLLPFEEDLIPFGSGFSMLTQVGVVQLPRSFYTLATLGVWGILIVAYAVHFRSLKHTIWLLPGVVLWFSYRSLQSYFIYWTPLLIIALFFWWEDATLEEKLDAA